VSRPSDLWIEQVELTFSDERLATPLHLSKGTISDITYAKVTIQARTRRDQRVQGVGAIFLSDLWAWPSPEYSHADKDAILRDLCRALAAVLRTHQDAADPLEQGMALEEALPAAILGVERDHPQLSSGALPYLAALNCLAPFDAAIHDAWGRGLQAASYSSYTAATLNGDLAVYLGKEFQSRYPADFLGAPRRRLRAQHVVGVTDPLSEHDAPPTMPGTLPTHLAAWVRRDNLTAFKVKSRGQEPQVDAERLAAVYRVATSASTTPAQVQLSIDPNEACPDSNFVTAMLDALEAISPPAYAALTYIEQPTGRDLSAQGFTFHTVSARKPVIIDESLDRLEHLQLLQPMGWSGLAVKTCKGQTHSLLAYCWAKHHGQFTTIQDLTNPGLALVHSANLCAHLTLSTDVFECNSRQYAPDACPAERAAFPGYFQLHDGWLQLPAAAPLGLY
jgi:L-alanine-DL-glutamate epimerase-like enolase superfamily enzyme